MEAQLITPPVDAPVAARASRARSRDALAGKLERYLRAAGVSDELQRRRYAVRAQEALQAGGEHREVSWAEIIGNLDEILCADLLQQKATLPGAKGRIALTVGQATGLEREWGAPRRSHRAMRPQSLAPWRPTLKELRQLPIPRAAQGLAACLCWLAVLVLP